jgi:hypothetical protein
VTRWAAALLAFLTAGGAAAGAYDCRHVDVLDAESGRRLVGIEDLVHHPPSDTLILSVHDRWADRDGLPGANGLYSVPVSGLSSGSGAVQGRSLTARAVRPHGVALREAGPDVWRLAVIDHRHYHVELAADGSPGTVIDDFEVSGNGELSFVRSTGGAGLCPANDLDWLDGDRVLVTLDRANCGGVARFLELSLAQWNGRLASIDLSTGETRILAEDLGFPNGVQVDGGAASVTLSREKRLVRYDLPSMREVGSRPLAGGDNLARDSRGRLLAAAHPDLMTFGLYSLRVWSYDTAPSLLLAFQESNSAVILDDPDGAVISGATSVVEAGGRYVAGAAFDAGLAVCTPG